MGKSLLFLNACGCIRENNVQFLEISKISHENELLLNGRGHLRNSVPKTRFKEQDLLVPYLSEKL